MDLKAAENKLKALAKAGDVAGVNAVLSELYNNPETHMAHFVLKTYAETALLNLGRPR